MSCYYKRILCFVLLDTGATASAISDKKAKELGLKIIPTKHKLVQIDESYLDVIGEVHLMKPSRSRKTHLYVKSELQLKLRTLLKMKTKIQWSNPLRQVHLKSQKFSSIQATSSRQKPKKNWEL